MDSPVPHLAVSRGSQILAPRVLRRRSELPCADRTCPPVPVPFGIRRATAASLFFWTGPPHDAIELGRQTARRIVVARAASRVRAGGLRVQGRGASGPLVALAYTERRLCMPPVLKPLQHTDDHRLCRPPLVTRSPPCLRRHPVPRMYAPPHRPGHFSRTPRGGPSPIQ